VNLLALEELKKICLGVRRNVNVAFLYECMRNIVKDIFLLKFKLCNKLTAQRKQLKYSYKKKTYS